MAARAGDCRWSIQESVVAAASAQPLAELLRSLLRFAVGSSEGSADREIVFGHGDSDGQNAYFVRTTGQRADAERCRQIEECLGGALPFSRVPAELTELVAAARTLVTRHEGAVWLTNGRPGELTFWFRGPHG